MLQSRHSLTMAPKRRRAHPAPNGKRQHSEAGASAAAEPPLAVANRPQRLIQFHRSEDDKVFVELTTLWRWLSGNLNSTQGERRLAMTLRRRGYNGAKFTAPTDGPGVVKHVELSFATHPKIYPVADAEALRDFLQELDQDVIDANRDLIVSVFQRMGAQPGQLVTYYPRVALIENGGKLAIIKRQGCKPRLALFALLKMLAPDYDPWDLFYRKGLQEFLAACGVLEPSANTQAQDGAFAEGGAEGPRRIMFDVENISEHENAAVTGGGRTQGRYAFCAHQS